MKKRLSLLLAATLITTLGTTSALATMPAKNDSPTPFKLSGSYKSSLRFSDVLSTDWSLRFVTEASTKGIISGDGYGKFRPSANVSHEEAIIMTIRAMGLTDEALQLKDTKLQLPDAVKVSAWARPFVALAIANGFLDQDAALHPQAYADREWVTELVVRAMGLDAEAKAHMSDKLTFKDASQIEADAVGYIAVAVDQGVITGYPNQTFQPNKPVKRNEMAVILCNAENSFEYDDNRQAQTQGLLNGTIGQVTSDGLTFKSRTHQDLTLKFAATSFVFVGDKLSAKSALQAGMSVRLFLNAQGEIVLVHAKKEAPQRELIETFAHGQVLAYTAPQAGKKGSITLLLQSKTALKQANKKLTLDIAADAAVMMNAQSKTFSDVKIGDRVGLTILNNTVVSIDVIPGTLQKFPE
ncbi:S-layer family protein [Tumebacillus sp. BK434]|uniref:S-layer homology domain-containing protein n=1 Tax=Tumebacillus sp. BK434 TaxID=2512169 RepID=UPI0010452CEC|nr:S-layer homology domain-containing protein [Tumebacillus sp. BK434]TCP59488.1 S-layer family protein [Tumebacillus sp. BK434]